MARNVIRGLIGTQDLSLGTSTFTRSTSIGGTQTLNQISPSAMSLAAGTMTLVAGSATHTFGTPFSSAPVASITSGVSTGFTYKVTTSSSTLAVVSNTNTDTSVVNWIAALAAN